MNILFTSAGRRSYLVQYFKEALQGNGEVHVINSSDISTAFQIADKAAVSPLIYDEEYIPFLLDYCKNFRIAAIIPLFDIDLPILAQNKSKFEEIGTKVLVSTPETIRICNDKWKTYQFLKYNEFSTPATYLYLKDALYDLKREALSYPLIVKPRWGMGSIAVYEAENEMELKVFLNKTKNEIKKTYLKYESVEDMEASVLIQEKINGQEYGLDIMNDLAGNYILTAVKRKYSMRSGETDCAVTVEDKSARRVGERLGCKLHHICNLDVDIIKKKGGFYILDMNARFGGGYPFSHVAGANLPLAIIKWLNGVKVEQTLLEPKKNTMVHKDIRMVQIENWSQ